MPQIVGILNLTTDSFSDGGSYRAPDAAIAHGEALLAAGADWLDIGAEASNPAAERVPAAEEIARLEPVVKHFVALGARVSVDTNKAPVMEAVLGLGAAMINDVTALRDPDAASVLARSPRAQVVLMYARNRGVRAEARTRPHRDLIPELLDFFQRRIAALGAAGIAPERIIVDPGMGLFLGSNPEPSLWALKHLRTLVAMGRPVYVSTSRKSFIGTLLGGKPPIERAAGTLATEIWAMSQGAAFIRTHDVRPLADARALWRAIEAVG